MTFRFAAQILYYDCEPLILRAIANCAPWVERIYVLYGRLPWAYNPVARETLPNPASLELLEQSPHKDKIVVVDGDWRSEEAQRNEGLERARHDGFDFLIIQDADEFFLPSEWEKNLAALRRAPDYPFYKTPWYVFWKTTEHVVVWRWVRLYRRGKMSAHASDTLVSYSTCFAINLRRHVRFVDKRMPDGAEDPLILPGVCCHLSMVMSDEQMLRKVSTWGHTQQVSRFWYRAKWLGWKPGVRDLGLITGTEWSMAVRYAGPLPAELDGFSPGLQEHVEPPRWVKVAAAADVRKQHARFALQELRRVVLP